MRIVLAAALAVAMICLGLAGANAYSQRQQALAAQAALQEHQRETSATRAWSAFEALTAVDPNASLNDHAWEFALARTPADFDVLRERWTLEAEVATLDLAYLSAESGGVEGTVPNDISDLGRSIQAAAEQAAGLGISTDPAGDLALSLADYARLPLSERVDQHDSIRDALAAGLQTLTTRVSAKRDAADLAGRVDDLVSVASTVGIPADLAQQIADAKTLSASATSDGDVRAADQRLQAVTAKLNAIINRTDGAPLPPCLDGPQPAYLIWIHLDAQQLVAYENGCPWLATAVTTGRPALPTDRGTWSIFYKSFAYHMISPWPKGSPFYYPPTWVYYAMEFVGDGTFIHNADWQPDYSYGPGSQYGPYASHGCVHVRDGVLPSLYAWAPIGTTVIVGD